MGKSANYWGKEQKPDSSRKRTDNFSVRKILLFLAHLKSPVPQLWVKTMHPFLFPHYVVCSIHTTIMDKIYLYFNITDLWIIH